MGLYLKKIRFDETSEDIIKQIISWQDPTLCEYIFTYHNKLDSIVSKVAYMFDNELMGVSVTEQFYNSATGNGHCVVQYLAANPFYKHAKIEHAMLASILRNEDKILGTEENPKEFSTTFSKSDKEAKELFEEFGFDVEETRIFDAYYASKNLNFGKVHEK